MNLAIHFCELPKVLLFLTQRAHAALHGARQRQRAHPHALPHHPGIRGTSQCCCQINLRILVKLLRLG